MTSAPLIISKINESHFIDSTDQTIHAYSSTTQGPGQIGDQEDQRTTFRYSFQRRLCKTTAQIGCLANVQSSDSHFSRHSYSATQTHHWPSFVYKGSPDGMIQEGPPLSSRFCKLIESPDAQLPSQTGKVAKRGQAKPTTFHSQKKFWDPGHCSFTGQLGTLGSSVVQLRQQNKKNFNPWIQTKTHFNQTSFPRRLTIIFDIKSSLTKQFIHHEIW